MKKLKKSKQATSTLYTGLTGHGNSWMTLETAGPENVKSLLNKLQGIL